MWDSRASLVGDKHDDSHFIGVANSSRSIDFADKFFSILYRLVTEHSTVPKTSEETVMSL